MFGNTGGYLANRNQVLLCWAEGPDLEPREETADVIEADQWNATLRISVQVPRNTEVELGKSEVTGLVVRGVVNSCVADDTGRFVLQIQISVKTPLADVHRVDPGALALDDFLSEEQEAQILKDLERGEAHLVDGDSGRIACLAADEARMRWAV